MKPIKVGLLGIGTVGSGTFNVLQRNQGEIQRRAGRGIEITMVADLDVDKAQTLVGPGVKVVADARALIAQRQQKPLQSVSELGDKTARGEGQYSVSSRFFEMYTEVRQGPHGIAENALLQRDGPEVRTLWRQPVAPGGRPAPQARPAPA